MLVNLKVQSTFAHLFNNQTSFDVDLDVYADIFQYLRSMHPAFFTYIKKLDRGEEEDPFVFLDSNKQVLNPEAMFYKRAKDGDTIYIAPAIVGGGGKKGLFAIFAIAALAIFVPGVGTAISGLFAGGGGGLTGVVGTATQFGIPASAVAGQGGILAGMGGLLKTLALNVGLSLITAAFQPRPKSGSGEEGRESDIFSGLTNTTTSGTPVPIHYGLVRTAGQLLSGYIWTETHGKEDVIHVGDKFFPDPADNPIDKGAKGAEFLKSIASKS